MIEHEIISLAEAKRRGLRNYFLGTPCKNGHIALRRVSGARCSECCRFKQKEDRRKNRARHLEREHRYRAKHKERWNAKERERYAQNPEKHRAKVRRQYATNGEIIRAKRRAYHYEVYKDPEIRRAAVERTNQWAKDNPERRRAQLRNQKAKRKNVSGKHTGDDINSILKLQKGKCAYCKLKVGKKYHVDHIIPVAKGGTNYRQNLQITCADCNLSKGARDPVFHAQMLGMLL